MGTTDVLSGPGWPCPRRAGDPQLTAVKDLCVVCFWDWQAAPHPRDTTSEGQDSSRGPTLSTSSPALSCEEDRTGAQAVV